ncbi:cytochrome b5, partial [Rhodotorula sp. JG-1b]
PSSPAGLLPPPNTTKVVKAPKGRVRVEKGFSQLDWAKLNRSGEVDLRGGVDSLLRVTPSELAKHNTREDCWQVYAGRVYNVGPFLRYHPGGVGEMMRGAGKDGEFRSFAVLAHAWVNYETLLENCLVGFLVPE